MEDGMPIALLATCVMLVSCLSSSTLKMEATCSSKTLVNFQWTAQHYIQEDRTFGGYVDDQGNPCFYGV
jgi:starvation-inducible outer membrane lipoprotein